MCILLVEDDDLIREVMSETLRDAGYEVVEAEDGLRALQVIGDRAYPFCALLTDFHMPGNIDGAQVAAVARDAFPDIPVIVASGRSDVLGPELRTGPGYRVLQKPYLPSQLLAILRSLVQPSPSR